MTIKIIDNKKVDMTSDEWRAYEVICKSYDSLPEQRGSDLFAGLFEVDESGIIIFLRPPSNKMCTFEVFLFCASLMIHQHLRLTHGLVEKMTKKVDEKLKLMDEKLEKLSQKFDK